MEFITFSKEVLLSLSGIYDHNKENIIVSLLHKNNDFPNIITSNLLYLKYDLNLIEFSKTKGYSRLYFWL